MLRSTLILISTLVISSCGGPSSSDGENITAIDLPTDTALALNCPNVGIFDEVCILQDPDNPYRTTPVREFNLNDTDAITKFELNNQISAAENSLGQKLSKARFYLWATAMARFPSGENQYFTALYLAELLNEQIIEFGDPDYEGDPIIREQSLKAYRSLFDNFFGSVTFFIFAFEIDGQVVFSPDGRPPPNFDPERGDRELPVSFLLNQLAADDLYRGNDFDGNGIIEDDEKLVPGDPVLVLNLLSEWGYTYEPCTFQPSTGGCTGGVVSVNEFP